MEFVIALISTVLGIVVYFFTKRKGVAPLVTVFIYIVIQVISYGELTAVLADYKLIISALISYILVWSIDGGKGDT